MASRPVLAALVLLTGCTTSQTARLERELAAQPSATAVLGAVCQQQHGPSAPLILAERVSGEPSSQPRDLLQLLAPGLDEPIELRHVRLKCGDATLSEAYNWYLPNRLPGEVARQLETTDTPFGKALAPLRFTRKRLWSRRGRAVECPEGTVLSQSAVLVLPERGPVSMVIECYTGASLGRGD